MFRKSLAPDQGMLFIFEKECLPGIWMKNVRFPLDILWLDQNKTIVDIKKNALLCGAYCEVFYPREGSKFVIEVNAGFANKYQLSTSQSVEFNLP